MRTAPLALALLVGTTGTILWATRFRQPKLQTMEHLTPVYEVKQLYPSMKGPEYTNQKLYLEKDTAPELLWIRGYEAVMVGEDGTTPKPQKFMCHNTLSIHRTLNQHRRLFGCNPYGTRRLFTLSQGQYSVDLPEGCAIPVVSAEKLMLQSQVLNLNTEDIGEKVRHKVKAHFVRDSELKSPMRPLCIFPSGVSVPTSDPQARPVPKEAMESGCAVDAGGCPIDKDSLGQFRTGHWVVPPGRDERHTAQPNLFPFDTTIHYIAAHVHPYAESFELRDLTTNTTVWKADGESLTQGVGLDRISHYASPEGIPVFARHRYELVSVYDNKSKEDQTAMAFMFFYVHDKFFRKPDARALATSDDSFCGIEKDPAMLR